MIQMPNGALLRTVMVAALGGLLLGFDTKVIAGATQSLTTTFELSPAELGFTVVLQFFAVLLLFPEVREVKLEDIRSV